MRDNKKDEYYFRKYLAEKNNEMNQQLIRIRKVELMGEKPSELTLNRLLTLQLEHFYAIFSLGETKKVLDEQYLSLLDTCSKVNSVLYSELLTILSIGVLLGQDPLAVIQDLLQEHQDDFLGLFTGYLKGTEEFGFEPEIAYPYILLYLNIALTESPQESEQIIYDYLTIDWFESQDEEYWHDYLNYDGYLYFGYWCFEAMALAKIYGVDTTRLVQSDYFALL